MAVLVPCPSCASRLLLGEQVMGKRIKCPKCGGVFLAERPTDDAAPDGRITEHAPIQKPKPAAEKAVKVLPPPLPKPSAPEEEPDDDPDEDDDRPRKKKKGKKKRKRQKAGWAEIGYQPEA